MTDKNLSIGHFLVGITDGVDREAFGLSPRETQILDCLISGLNVKETAERLDVSPHTVDVFKRRIFKKMGVHNAASAAALGMAELLGAEINAKQPESPAGSPETSTSPLTAS